MANTDSATDLVDLTYWHDGLACCSTRWEEAYTRFETPAEEINKFIGRCTRIGMRSWSRSSNVVELFCGRGNGLKALERMGFTRLEGVDLSLVADSI